ncbi:hypothetical protein DZA35_01745 [Arcobacter sp. HD9-500m-PIT-SAG03]|nr:hypothetical protein DZA35_01745 [Arcobacter sp. HD9-500m-PIT-SAG03]
MNDRLHEVIAQCAVIHETNIHENIIYDIEAIEDKLLNIDSDIKDHYLVLLLQYYFQQNNVGCAQKLLLQGIKFQMRFDDIKEAFIHINSGKENVINFFEDNVVMLKDTIKDEELTAMYDYYMKNEQNKVNLEEALILIKKNRYICAHVHKSTISRLKFFLNPDLLASLERDMPFLLK